MFRSLTNLGTILDAIAPVGTVSLNNIGPNPLVSTPRPALVPSPETLITLVHNLSVCSGSVGSTSTSNPFLNAFPVGGTNLIKAPANTYFNVLVEEVPTFNKELSTTLLKYPVGVDVVIDCHTVFVSVNKILSNFVK